LIPRVAVIVFVLGPVKSPVVFSLALMMPPTLPQHAMDCAMSLVLISCDSFEMAKDFEICGVW